MPELASESNFEAVSEPLASMVVVVVEKVEKNGLLGGPGGAPPAKVGVRGGSPKGPLAPVLLWAQGVTHGPLL